MLTKKHWWESDRGQAHEELEGVTRVLLERQAYRHSENVRNMKLYGNTDYIGLSGFLYAQPNPITAANRITWNVIQSCVDTAAAKIAKNKPLPKFLTDGGDWELQQKAKNLSKFMAGSFYLARTVESSQAAFTDAGVFGTGLKKITPDFVRKCVRSERVNPDEVLVDDAEAWYGDPREMHQKKTVSKWALTERYPEHRAAIEALQPEATPFNYVSTQGFVDMVTVWESWHLGFDKKPGRHCIWIKGATLLDEEWKWKKFPFAKMVFNPRLIGFWGQGIPDMIVGIQIEINKILRHIQTSFHLNSAPFWVKEASSGTPKTHFTNEIGRIMEYKGVAPELKVFATVHPEMFQHLESLYRRAFELVGISQLSAQSKKPSGLDSGAALREFNDIETERFALVGQRWERFHMDEAELHLLAAKDIAEKFPDFTVPARSKDDVEFIRWKDVQMDEDAYQLQVFPVSSLPREPAARTQVVAEWAQAGFIDPDTTMELMDLPDLSQYRSTRLARRRLVEKVVQEILEKGEMVQPEPFMDLSYAMQYATLEYNRAQLGKCPEGTLEVMRRFIEQTKYLQDQAQLAMQPVAPQAMPVPQQ